MNIKNIPKSIIRDLELILEVTAEQPQHIQGEIRGVFKANMMVNYDIDSKRYDQYMKTVELAGAYEATQGVAYGDIPNLPDMLKKSRVNMKNGK